MTKRTQHIESEDIGEFLREQVNPNNVIEWHQDGLIIHSSNESLQRLIDSGIVTATDSAISWREGHLEHVAALYVSNPVQTWRDYADDLTVALSADGSTFAALVEKARGE